MLTLHRTTSAKTRATATQGNRPIPPNVSVHIMKHLFTILFFACTILPISGTGQPIDILIWHGDTLITYNRLLETYPNWEMIQAKISSALERNDKQLHPEKYNNNEIELSYYVAEWHVINNQLFLSNIYQEWNFDVRVDLQEIFSLDLDNGLLFANWVVDEISFQKGNIIVPGIIPFHENELVLQISCGKIIGNRSYTNYIAKKPWYDSSENPNTLMALLYSNINWAKLPDYENKRPQVFVSVHPNKKGKLDRIELSETYMIYDNIIITDPSNPFIKEAVKVVRKIPEWYVIYHRNSILNQSIQIVFSRETREKYAR